jgi:type VI secretion system secreted protein VgrG
MSSLEVALHCESLGDCTVLDLSGREAMDSLSSWRVRVHVAQHIDASVALRTDAVIALHDPLEGTERRIRLLVTEISGEINHGRDRVIELHLADPPWLLQRRGGYRLFQEKTTEQIVGDVLKAAGIPAAALVPRLADSYPVRLQCVQYAESEWAFLERLLADDGISYWFDTTTEGEHRIFLGDSAGSHDGIEGGATLPYVGKTGAMRAGKRGFSSLEWEERVATDRVQIRDFDVRHPDVYIEGESGTGTLGYFEYPASVPTAEAAAARAKRRLEQLRRDQISVRGQTDCVRVRPGRIVEIAGAGADLFDQRMLIAEAQHRYARPLRDGGQSIPYHNQLTLKPTKAADSADHAAHRPPIRRGPALEHLESAVTTGPGSEEIHVDDLGRVKLRFLWDRSGVTDDKSSHWARCLQYPLGASMFLPRVGWEVSLAYLDGSPDRPFVLGRLYNATAVVPYSLPAASATTSFQSWTTPRSGMTQEIKMIDDAGSQELFVHASRDLSVNVGATHTTTIAGDNEHSVGLSLTTSVLGSQSTKVAAMQSLDVGKEIQLTVTGANHESIGGAELVNVTGNRAVVSSSTCVELVGAGYSLLCNQSNVKVDGNTVRAVGGSKTIISGLGVSESVAGARSYVCLGSRTISCGQYADTVYGGKRSTVSGAVNENAAAITTAATSGTISPATASIHAGGKVSITAPTILIEVGGTLTAGTLTLGGGALQVTGGTTVIQGTTSRSGGKVGS